MAKTALITGVTGQDGAYLARLLLGKGYKVFGTQRAESAAGRARLDYLQIADQVDLLSLELADSGQIQRVLDRTAPDEIYNLAAHSSVHASFEQPIHASGMRIPHDGKIPCTRQRNSQDDHPNIKDQVVQDEFAWRECALDQDAADSNQDGCR